MRALEGKVDVHGIAHVTGGSFKKNLPRVLPPGVAGEVSLSSWRPPPLFRHLAAKAGLTGAEPYDFLNMGCGLLVIVPQKDAPATVDLLKKAGEVAWVAGRLVASPSKEGGHGARLVP